MRSLDPRRVEFSLARMSPTLLVMTVIILALPVLFFWLALVGSPLFLVPAVLLLLGYAGTWLWLRPRRFVVSPDGLRLEWPLRSATVPSSDIVGARVLSGRDFHREYGWGIRFGAGGLWGGFGRLKTRKGTLWMYISRVDQLVFLHRKSVPSLLITPRDPARFVSAVEEIVARD